MLKKFVRTFAAALIAVFIGGVALSAASAATGAPTNGQNVGFRFINNPVGNGTLNVHAGFLQADGSGLSMCGITSGSAHQDCTYDFKYSINGSQATTTQASAFTYWTWPTITDANKDAVLCRDPSTQQLADNGPHTNYNCFNQNTYGEIFKPASSGALSGFSMAMTCLSPTGATILTANLYETSTPAENPNPQSSAAFANSTINATPLASATFTLSTCATSWSGKAFSDADFSYPTMDFGSVNLDSTKWYAVLFTGDAIAGTKPAGAVTAPAASSDTTKPVIKGKKASQVLIDTRFVATYTANEKVNWSVSGGKDADLFNIDENGKLRFKKKQNETGKYEVQVTATDTAGNISDPISVKVEVVKEITEQVATGNTPMSNNTKTAMAVIAIAAAGGLVVSLRKTI